MKEERRVLEGKRKAKRNFVIYYTLYSQGSNKNIKVKNRKI